jgi:hypothetical protein
MAVTIPAVAVWIHAHGARISRSAILTLAALYRQGSPDAAKASPASSGGVYPTPDMIGVVIALRLRVVVPSIMALQLKAVRTLPLQFLGAVRVVGGRLALPAPDIIGLIGVLIFAFRQRVVPLSIFALQLEADGTRGGGCRTAVQLSLSSVDRRQEHKQHDPAFPMHGMAALGPWQHIST